MVSQLVRGRPEVVAKITQVDMASLKLSAVTEAELRFGLARRPEASKLHRAAEELLLRIDILDWDRTAARRYATLRADLERRGTPIAPIDLMIAAHALSIDATLVTNDQAFRHATDLAVEDWLT